MIKMDGKEVTFKEDKITRSIHMAMLHVKIDGIRDTEPLIPKICKSKTSIFNKAYTEIPIGIQNIIFRSKL